MTGVLVPAPKCKPAMFGLLAVSEIVPAPDDEHWQGGIEYDLPTCADMFVISSDCLVQDIEKPTEDGSLSTADGVPFTMVAAYKCATVGRIPDEAWEHAKDRLDRGEARTLERAFWTGVDVEGNPLEQSLNGNADVVDLTPVGGAVSVTDGLAMLEGWAGINMPCSPVVHASRGIGVYLAERGLTEIYDGELISKGTGTLVSIGGGYLSTGPGGVVPDDGEAWFYITGGIRIIRGETFYTPPRGQLGSAVDRLQNDITIFAERTYAIEQDCVSAAVLVSLATCCG